MATKTSAKKTTAKAPAKGPAKKGDAASKQSDQIRDVVLEAAAAQLAASSAAIKFWEAWIRSADNYTTALGDELARVSQGDVEPSELAGRLTDITRQYLREMTEVPGAAAKHFNTQLEKIGKPKKTRTRAARVKE